MGSLDFNRAAMFVRVVEFGSFTAAARSLGVPTSSVSRAVTALEEELEVLLLQRTARKLVLTTAGSAFFERAREAVALLVGAADAALDDKAPRGLVRLTAPTEVTPFLSRTLTGFRQLYPDIRVEVLFTPRYVDLIGEGVDLALRAGVMDSSQLIVRKVSRSSGALYAAKSYLARRGAPKQLDELAQHDCVVLRGKDNSVTWELVGPEGSQKVRVQPALLCNAIGFVLAAVCEGAGIGVLPATYADELADVLVRVLPEYQTNSTDFSVVSTSRTLPQRVSLLRDYLIEALVQHGQGPPNDERVSRAMGSPVPRSAIKRMAVGGASSD